jgi:ABC-type phosphate/phosphonate transport system permease subunit
MTHLERIFPQNIFFFLIDTFVGNPPTKWTLKLFFFNMGTSSNVGKAIANHPKH